MKKIITILVMACVFSAANANYDARVQAFVQPFDQSYALSQEYLWYWDIDLTFPTGNYCDVWYMMYLLRNWFPGYSFSHIPYVGLNDFLFGRSTNGLYFQTIYSDLD